MSNELNKPSKIEAAEAETAQPNEAAKATRNQVGNSVVPSGNIVDDPDFLERVFVGAKKNRERLREADRQDWSAIADCLDGVGNHANSFYPDSED